jgi:hypothetical protein
VQLHAVAPRVAHERLVAVGAADDRIGTSSPWARSVSHHGVEVVVEQGEVLAHFGWRGELNEVDLLAPGIEPGAGEAEVGPGEVLGQPEDLGVEGRSPRARRAR